MDNKILEAIRAAGGSGVVSEVMGVSVSRVYQFTEDGFPDSRENEMIRILLTNIRIYNEVRERAGRDKITITREELKQASRALKGA